MRLIIIALLMLLSPASALAQARIDLYDKKSNRQGYAIVDPRTGRIDTFDKYSNRTGYGQITTPPPPIWPLPPPPPACPKAPCR